MGALKPPVIRDIADTAFWVASYRAEETRRPDALFSDPFAERLAGERGAEIANHMRLGRERGWAVVVRTRVIDDIVAQAVRDGTDTVVNMGSGFDTRPYRLTLPATLRWFDVDHAKVLAHKKQQLEGVAPQVTLAFVEADLTQAQEREKVLQVATEGAKNVLVLSEGVMCYLEAASVQNFATALGARPAVTTWVADFMSPAMMQYACDAWKSELARAPFVFSVDNAGDYFQPLGWREQRWYSTSEQGCLLRRAPTRVVAARLVHQFVPEEKQAWLRSSGVAHLVRLH